MNAKSILSYLILLGLMVFQPSAVAQEFGLEDLRNQLVERGEISGEFAQCVRQKTTNIFGHGNFNFEPDKQLELNFAYPNLDSMNLAYDEGEFRVVINGVRQAPSRISTFRKLIFSIINLHGSVLNRNFEIDLHGTIEKFDATLKPRKRLAKIVNRIELSGTDGLVKTTHIYARDDRVVTIYLSPLGEVYSDEVCQ